MDRTTLMEMRKGIDFAFRDFSRTYGDAIEAFFDPLLYFLVWLLLEPNFNRWKIQFATS